MPEKTKQNETDEKEEKVPAETPESDEENNWSKDQREKSYYYDDSYGYEVYNPDKDEDEE